MSVSDNLLTGEIYEIPETTSYPVFLSAWVFDGEEFVDDYTGSILDNNGRTYEFSSESPEVILSGSGLTSFTVTAVKDGETILDESFTANLTLISREYSPLVPGLGFELSSKAYNTIDQVATEVLDAENDVYAIHDFPRAYTSGLDDSTQMYYKTGNRADMFELTLEPSYPYSRDTVTKSDIEGAITDITSNAHLRLDSFYKEKLGFTNANYSDFSIFIDESVSAQFDQYGEFTIPAAKVNTNEDVQFDILKEVNEPELGPIDVPVIRITLKGGVKVVAPDTTDSNLSVVSADGTVAYTAIVSDVVSTVNVEQTVDTVTVKKRSQTESGIPEYFVSPIAATVDGYLGVNVPVASGTYADLVVGTTIWTRSATAAKRRINNVEHAVNVTVANDNLALAIPIPSGVTAEEISAIALYVGVAEEGAMQYSESLAVAMPCVLQTAQAPVNP